MNTCGDWCFKNGLCQHNLMDAPTIMDFICSGLGGDCKEGSAYSIPPSRCKNCQKGAMYLARGLCEECIYPQKESEEA
jgi:hypothetical protein